MGRIILFILPFLLFFPHLTVTGTEETASIPPKPFMPELFNRYGFVHGRIVFSPGDREAFWDINTPSVNRKRLLRKDQSDAWQDAGPSFLSIHRMEKDPCYSPDGQRVVYQSRAPIPEVGAGDDINLWFRKREKDGWGPAVPLETPVNTPDNDETSPWLGPDNTLVFCRTNNPVLPGQSGGSDIFISDPSAEGKYSEPVRLGTEVNSEYQESGPVLSPDNRYLLFISNRPGGFSRMMNLYISYRKPEGGWTKARCISQDIGIVNAWFPSLSPDGRFLYLCGGYPTQNGYDQSSVFRIDTHRFDRHD